MLAKSIFKMYDIRGIVDDTLTVDGVKLIGRAFGTQALTKHRKTVLIARDGRLHSAKIVRALAEGICSSGCDVIDIGMVPTPVLYFATVHLNTGTGIMVTGSHNPPQYNGLKMMIDEHTLYGDDIQNLLNIILEHDYTSGTGSYRQQNISEAYLTAITDDIHLDKPLNIVIDCGNGVTGKLAPELFKRLGCHVKELHTEIDGSFPNHHPDPSKPENLVDVQNEITTGNDDIGFAFDGDGDRVGIIDNKASIIWPDRQLMLHAKDILSRNPGGLVIYDVKCSAHLDKVISDHGGTSLMWKAGHSLMKAKMRETGALIGGEMSGHIFFKERWNGFDDGLYSAARMLEIISKKEQSAADIFAELPDSHNTPEIQVNFAEGEHFRFMESLKAKARFPDASISTIDGMRVKYQHGWGLIRPSHTTPCLVLRFEADTAEDLEQIQAIFREQMHNIDETLKLGF